MRRSRYTRVIRLRTRCEETRNVSEEWVSIGDESADSPSSVQCVEETRARTWFMMIQANKPEQHADTYTHVYTHTHTHMQQQQQLFLPGYIFPSDCLTLCVSHRSPTHAPSLAIPHKHHLSILEQRPSLLHSLLHLPVACARECQE